MELFSGAYGVFRNPSGRREVEYVDPANVSRIVLLADLLLHLLDRVEDKRGHATHGKGAPLIN